MARSVLRALPLGVMLILLAVACQASSEDSKKKIAACPPKKGYTTLANTAWVYSAVSNGKKTHGSAAAAEAACAADSSCVGFNFNGASIRLGAISGVVQVPGACSYIKKKCPVKSGYTAVYGFSWTLAASASETVAASADAAEAACSGSDTCSGFNSLGKYVTGEIAGEVPSLAPVCTYFKDDCADRYGYTAYPHTALEAVAGEDGIATGQLAGGLDEAAEFCKLDFRCTGFSSDGSYYIGGVSQLVPSVGVCSYIKDPCPPMAGFIVYADANLVKDAYDGRQSAKCFTDVYKACKENSTCKAFNNLRYVWNSLPHHDNLESQLDDATGVCFYVKIEETADGRPEDEADR